METQNNRMVYLQEALSKTLEGCFESNWADDIQNNWGFVIDLEAIAGMAQNDVLRVLDRSVDVKGIEIYVAISDAITSLAEITHAVYHLLSLAAESFLVILPKHDGEALRYWFATGTATHGHRGEIIIQRASMQHIDLSALDTKV